MDLGLLVSNVWSFAGESNRPTVNQMLLQYFVNYNLKAGWYLSSAPIITANWVAPKAKDVCTVLRRWRGKNHEGGISAHEPSAQVYANAVSPHGSSDWGIRLTIAFQFPKLTQQEELLLQEIVTEVQQTA